MIEEDKAIVMDIDGTLCHIKSKEQKYSDVEPIYGVLNKLKEYKEKGYYIIFYTSRQMRTYEGNVGKINANTAKTVLEWLDKYEVPYDEIYFGKPWCGRKGFYVDDKAIRPKEFEELSLEQINELIERDKG